ncbi:MAG: DUF1631 family protein [Rhodoferax sp.]|nr:DUF1631 family protein [Rhodoferax sp.]
MATPQTLTASKELARTVRQQFLAQATAALADMGAVVQERLTELMDEMTNARESQTRRDVWMAFRQSRSAWVEATAKAWRESLQPMPAAKRGPSLEAASFELVGAEVVENKILASRMVLFVHEKVLPQLDDLRIRIKYLEAREDLEGHDIFRPEVLVVLLVEHWTKSGMRGEALTMVMDVVQRLLVERLTHAYQKANDYLIQHGVMPHIELHDRVKMPSRQAQAQRPGADVVPSAPQSLDGHEPRSTASGYAAIAPSHPAPPLPRGMGQTLQSSRAPTMVASGPNAHSPTAPFGGRLDWGGGTGVPLGPDGPASSPASVGLAPYWHQSLRSDSLPSHLVGEGGVAQAAPIAATPRTRAHHRAQGLVGQLRRWFSHYSGVEGWGAEIPPASPALSLALGPAGTMPHGDLIDPPLGVGQVAGALREQSEALKQKAETKSEKATIEIVDLMFQAILAEERIPPGVRVWFARLQMPVLRVALEDPDFLGTTTHPARLLIDRMGSCVMGFDDADVQSRIIEAEIRRVVQVVEQYPETGKRVYQIVYDEFQKFLSKFLTESGPAHRLVTVAQQVEQKEALAIQYTIELRDILKDMPVHDTVREYMFKVWAEVLAVCALRKGAQHADTLHYKTAATDLIWAASAKTQRNDRTKVIQDLPALLMRLRMGMDLLGMPAPEQESHLKRLNDTMADAFLSKTQPVSQATIDAMAQRLSHLEDVVTEDGMGDLPLDAESLEMMLGIDASMINVVSDGGAKPTAVMLAWAQELELGTWYTLDFGQQITVVQFVWRSARKHLNLFAQAGGTSYLIQGGRLAAYLQAGLLLPQEEESLTARATRNALSKLEAEPQRLLK